jgi:hypothetical protein
VVLDGQGNRISPASSGSSDTVGIWVRLTDISGKSITGVSIKNVTIDRESSGIYIEGADSSDTPWGVDLSDNMADTSAVASARSLMISDTEISLCKNGIIVHDHPDAILSGLSLQGSSGSGIIAKDSQVRLSRSSLIENQEYGIEIQGGTQSEISSVTIRGNEKAGVSLDSVSDIRIYDNIFDNPVNIIAHGSDAISLSVPREVRDNIIGGPVVGGNYWAGGGGFAPVSDALADDDQDGIGDIAYDAGIGVLDLLPLVRRTSLSDAETSETLETIQTPLLTPAPVATPLSFISGIHAIIVGDTIPAEMDPGKVYPVSLDLLNDGSDDWISQYQVGIIALDEAAEFGPAWIPAPVMGPIRSGQTLAIPVSLKSPSKSGTYTLRFQAARVGSGVEVIYGRAYAKTVTVR